MSIVSQASKSIVSNKRSSAAANAVETSEYDGFWINVGVYIGEGENQKFVRLPRGIAVSDLVARKLYESMDPEFATQVHIMNEMIAGIQEMCLKANEGKPMTEGQSMTINLSAQLYRRQEGTEAAPEPELSSSIRKALFAPQE